MFSVVKKLKYHDVQRYTVGIGPRSWASAGFHDESVGAASKPNTRYASQAKRVPFPVPTIYISSGDFVITADIFFEDISKIFCKKNTVKPDGHDAESFPILEPPVSHLRYTPQ